MVINDGVYARDLYNFISDISTPPFESWWKSFEKFNFVRGKDYKACISLGEVDYLLTQETAIKIFKTIQDKETRGKIIKGG